MTNKSKFLKNVLTTASATTLLAVIGVSSATATVVTNKQNVSTDAADFNDGTGNVQYPNGSSMIATKDDTKITINAGTNTVPVNLYGHFVSIVSNSDATVTLANTNVNTDVAAIYKAAKLGSVPAFGKQVTANTNKVKGITVNSNSLTLDSNFNFQTNNIVIGQDATLVLGTNAKTVKSIDGKTIEGAVAGQGTLRVQGSTELIDTEIGANKGLASLQIKGGELNFNPAAGGKVITAKTIDLQDSVAALKLSKQTNITGDIVTTGKNNTGILSLNSTAGTKHTLTGNIGTADARIGTIAIANNNELEITNDANKVINFYVNNVTTDTTKNGGVVFAKADTVNISGTIGAEGMPLGFVRFKENSAGGGAQTINLLENTKVHVQDFHLDAAAKPVDNKLVLAKNTLIDGNVIINNAGANDIISVEGNSAITGTIGSKTKLLKELRFDTEGVELALGKNEQFVAAININKDATLSFAEDADASLDGTLINIAEGDAGVGTAKVNVATSGKTVTVGKVGDNTGGKHLKELQVTGGADVKVIDSVSIKKLNMGSSDASLTLDAKGADIAVTIPEFTHENDKVLVTVVDSTAPSTKSITIAKNSRLFGTKDNRIKGVQFDSNEQLVLETANNIYTGDAGINAKTAGEGNISFRGYHIVDAKIGNTTEIRTMDIQNIGAAAVFLQDVNIDGTLFLGANTTAFVNANFASNNSGVSGTAKNQGNLVFTNSDAIEFKADIGNAGTDLESVFIGDGDVTFSNANFNTSKLAFGFSTDKLAGVSAQHKQEINNLIARAGIKFDANSKATAIFTDANFNTRLGNLEITTTSKNRSHNILSKSTKDVDFTKAVATANNRFGNIEFSNDISVTISNAKFYAGIINGTGSADKVSVDIKAANGKITNLGSKTASLKQVTFTENAEITDGLYSKAITVANAKTATLGREASSSEGIVLGTGSSAVARDGTILDTKVTTATAKNGTVTFEGSGAVRKQLGTDGAPLSVVNFTAKSDPAKVIEISDDIYSVNINSSAQLTPKVTDKVLSGTTKVTGGGFNLQQNNLIFKNGASTVSGDIGVVLKFNGNQTGSLTVDGANNSLDMTKVTSLNFILEDAPSLVGSEQSFPIFKAINKADLNSVTDAANISINNDNRFIKWGFSNNNLTAVNDVDNAIKKAVSNVSKQDREVFAGQNISGHARDALIGWSNRNATSDKDFADGLKRLVEPEKNITQIAEVGFNAASDQSRNRTLDVMSKDRVIVVASGDEGITAGDEGSVDEKFGAWLSPFYTNATQKKRSNTAGYEATVSGMTVGADARLCQDFVLGAAFSYFNSSAKHKDFKSGDRTKSNGYAINVYGAYSITDNLFVNGMVHYGMVQAKQRERRIVNSTVKQTARSKADINTFGGEFLAGYTYKMDELNITPMAGVAYAHFNNDSYKETGTFTQNRKVKIKDTNKLEGILGLSVSTTPIQQDGLDITPEAHAFVRHDFLDQKAKIELNLDGLSKPLAPKSGKTNATFFNVGLGVKVKADMMEYGIGYDAHLADKYVAHQGTLKVRVNF